MWRSTFVGMLATMLFGVFGLISAAEAASSKELERDARKALETLYASTPAAKVLGEKAKAILVFPSITKGGLIVGAQYGEGTLFRDGAASAFYSTTAASYGLQAGLQKFGYALFFMDDSDLAYLRKSDGWEVGVGPTITIVDSGFAKTMSTTTARDGVFAFFFEQKGLMAGLGLQGTKITQFHPQG